MLLVITATFRRSGNVCTVFEACLQLHDWLFKGAALAPVVVTGALAGACDTETV